MPIAKFQVAAASDSLLAEDAIVNTLHFNVLSTSPDYNALAGDLATLFQTWYEVARQIRVVAYEVAGPPPHFPVGERVLNPGVLVNAAGPREVALCLSFFGERNLPRQRGRIYLAQGVKSSGLTSRPTVTMLTAAQTLAAGLSGLGGANVDWVVYSPTSGLHHKVSTSWVDNEWDTMRSRGRGSTFRDLQLQSG